MLKFNSLLQMPLLRKYQNGKCIIIGANFQKRDNKKVCL